VNSLVRKTLVVQLQAGDAERCPVLAHLGYDAADPFALTVVFSHDGRVLARWTLDREMVGDGLTRPVGVGDVRRRSRPSCARRTTWSVRGGRKCASTTSSRS
jgi:hypothetical protein